MQDSHVFLSFFFFQEFTDTKYNGKIHKETMYVRLCCMCKTTQDINVSSVKEKYYFQPYFLPLALQHLSRPKLLTYIIHGTLKYLNFICLPSEITQQKVSKKMIIINLLIMNHQYPSPFSNLGILFAFVF